MSKTRDTGFLGNVIKVDTSGNVSFVSGSTTLATINTSGQLSGSSPVLSSSYALNADLLDGLDSTQFTLTSSFAAQTASFTAYTASQNILNGTYATTGSNTFTGIQTVNSNLVVTGSITAQTLVVQTITSSVSTITGSTNFGSLAINTHTFTGSVNISGSSTTALNINSGSLFVSSSGNIGMGTITPTVNLLQKYLSITDNYNVGIILNDTRAGSAFEVYNAGADFYINYGTSNKFKIVGSTGAATFSNAAGITNGNGLNLRAGGNGAADANVLNFTSLAGTINASMFTDAANSNTRLKSLGNLSFHTGNIAISADNERMFISSSGNVGIGRDDPSYALDVWASIRASSNNTFSPSLYLNFNNTNVVRFLADQNSCYIISQNAYPVEIQTNSVSKALFGSGANADVSFFTYSGYKQFFSGGDQYNVYLNNAGSIMYLNYQGNGGIRAGTSQQVLYAGSDIRIKKDISLIDSTLDKVLALSPKIFKYKEGLDIPYYGFIAQDMEEVFPELVRTDSGVTMCNDEEIVNQKSIESYGLVWASILVKSIQEQQAQINELKAQING